MELLLLGVLVLALRSAKKPDPGLQPAPSGLAKPQPQPQPEAGTSVVDVVKAGLGAAGSIVAVVVPIVAAAGGGSVTAAGTGAAVEAGAEGAEVAADTTAEVAGVTAGGVLSTVGGFALVIGLFVLLFVSGPHLKKLYESQAEWARRRKYGKPGVIASLTEQCFTLEQEALRNVFEIIQPGSITQRYGTDAAVDYNSGLQTQQWQIATVQTAAPGTWAPTPNAPPFLSFSGAPGIPFSYQLFAITLARFAAVEQLRARNNAIYAFFRNGRGWSSADCGSNGVAIPPDEMDAWADEYCGTHGVTTWGLDLGRALPRSRRSVSPPSYAQVREMARSILNAGSSPRFELTLARCAFVGRAGAVTMCAMEGYSFGWPGDTQFTWDMESFCELGWRHAGLWLIDPASMGAINPLESRQFQAPQVCDAHLLIEPVGIRIAFPPTQDDLLRTQGVEPWL